MSELGFLLELLLNHKLPKDTKALIASRIKEVEERLSTFQPPPLPPQARPPAPLPPHMAQQAPSMQAIMARHPDLAPPPPSGEAVQEPQAVRVENVAQTPAALQAMQLRQNLINQAMSGNEKVAGGSTLNHKMRGALNPQPK